VKIEVEDGFGGRREVQVLKATKLCVPTSVDGQGIKHAEEAVMCYRAKATPKTSVSGVQVQDGFGTAVLDLKAESELCVPSEILP
jgi:hypothetical protein